MTDVKITNKEYEMLKHVIQYKANEAWAELNNNKDNLEYFKNSNDEEKIKIWQHICEISSARWSAYNDILKAVDLIK